MEINNQARNELLEIVSGLTDEAVSQKPAEGWSIKQVLEHLYLTEDFIATFVHGQLKTGERIFTEDKAVHLVAKRIKKVDAQSALIPSDSESSLAALQQKLTASHDRLTQIVAHADQQALAEIAVKHPAFGMLSLRQWIEFIGYHEQRHIEQIKEIIAELELK